MYVIIATVGSNDYFYGPYKSYKAAQLVVEDAEARKGDRAPDMRIVAFQPSDGFLLGDAARTYHTV